MGFTPSAGLVGDPVTLLSSPKLCHSARHIPTVDRVNASEIAVIIPCRNEAGSITDVLARVPEGPAKDRIVAVRQNNVLATSFHPEVTGDRRVHRYFVEMVRESGV